MFKKIMRKLGIKVKFEPSDTFQSSLESIKKNCDYVGSKQILRDGLAYNIAELQNILNISEKEKTMIYYPQFSKIYSNIFEKYGNLDNMKNLLENVNYYKNNLEIDTSFFLELENLIKDLNILIENLEELRNVFKKNNIMKAIEKDQNLEPKEILKVIVKTIIPNISTIITQIHKTVAIIETQHIKKEFVDPYSGKPIPDNLRLK